MPQVARTLTHADGKVCRVSICDRDAKWSESVCAPLHRAQFQREAEVLVVLSHPKIALIHGLEKCT